MGSPYSHLMGFFAIKLFAYFLAVPVSFLHLHCLLRVYFGRMFLLCLVHVFRYHLCLVYHVGSFHVCYRLFPSKFLFLVFSSCFDDHPFHTPILHISLPLPAPICKLDKLSLVRFTSIPTKKTVFIKSSLYRVVAIKRHNTFEK
jgi:hypothetical protein